MIEDCDEWVVAQVRGKEDGGNLVEGKYNSNWILGQENSESLF